MARRFGACLTATCGGQFGVPAELQFVGLSGGKEQEYGDRNCEAPGTLTSGNAAI